MCTTPSNRPAANTSVFLATLVAGAIGLTTGSAMALSSDRDKDLDVRANYNKLVAVEPSYALFKDNVRIEQGSLKASGDEARVYDSDGSASSGRRIVLTGSPAHLEQLHDNNGGMMTAQAAQIDYNVGSNIAILTGDVVVIQEGKSEFRGPRMTYNTNTGAMEGGSDTPGSEVHMTFKAKPRSAPKAAEPTS